MSDTRKLKQKLSKLADPRAPGTAAGRGLSASHPYECLTHILDEIGEIVLSRDLTVKNTAGQSLSLKVKGRRLIRLNLPAPSGIPEQTDLFGVELSSSDAQQMAALAHLFTTFCERGNALEFSTAKAAQADRPDEIGLSVDRIKQEVIRYTGFKPPQAKEAPFAFLEDMTASDTIAWVQVNGAQDPKTWGDAQQIQQLEQALKTTLPHLLAQGAPAHVDALRPQYWILGTGRTPAFITVIGALGDSIFAALVPADKTGRWHDLCRASIS